MARPIVAVLEDDPDIRAAMELCLGDWGYQSFAGADSADLAAALAGAGSPVRAIIADAHLSGGETVFDALAKLAAALAGAPVLIVTATLPMEKRAEAVAAGYALMAKPVDAARLRTWLLRHV